VSSTGQNFSPSILTPSYAIVDGDVTVFDSSAILLYLAEKTGKFLPTKTDKARAELLSWMFFVSSGVGPYFGQSVHFRNYAPEKIPYAINRYAFEAQRHAGILDARLAKQKYMLGDTYTIVDMNVWGWARIIPTVLGDVTNSPHSQTEALCLIHSLLVEEVSSKRRVLPVLILHMATRSILPPRFKPQ
jgi:glutathione S-transferase